MPRTCLPMPARRVVTKGDRGDDSGFRRCWATRELRTSCTPHRGIEHVHASAYRSRDFGGPADHAVPGRSRPVGRHHCGARPRPGGGARHGRRPQVQSGQRQLVVAERSDVDFVRQEVLAEVGVSEPVVEDHLPRTRLCPERAGRGGRRAEPVARRAAVSGLGSLVVDLRGESASVSGGAEGSGARV